MRWSLTVATAVSVLFAAAPGVAQWPPAPVEQTGQLVCHDVDGILVPCAGSHHDGDLRRGVPLPQPRFTDNGDGTVVDNSTGLVWLKDANCPGTVRDWHAAMADVAEFNSLGTMAANDCGDTSNGGVHQTDWRLPNVKELQSLLDFAYAHPALSNTAGTARWSEGDPFVNVNTSIPHWSSTTYLANTDGAIWVGMLNGKVDGTWKTNPRAVWPVRGEVTVADVGWPPAPTERSGQTTCFDVDGDPADCAGTRQDGDLQAGSLLPTPRFTDLGGGTVLDHLTGLTWLKNAECVGALRSWDQALAAVEELNSLGSMGGNDCGDSSNAGSHQTDWRLPNIREFASLMHFGYTQPAVSNAAGTAKWIEGDPFTNLNGSNYWSSTTNSGFLDEAFVSTMAWGYVSSFAKDAVNDYVWAVRGGPIFAGGFGSGDLEGWSGSSGN